MKYVSLFSGIEAATVAWEQLGWEPVCFAEFDEFPSAVLAERYPEVPNVGDVTKVNWKKYRNKVDLVVGSSPCQSFSIAGKREGLQGESGLMFEYIRAVREIRPRWFLRENVPGALSSENGEAFRQLLSEMDELGYSLAWRVLDAQFFGVAQRRRRLFLVGHLGAESPAEVLFEPDCLSGNPQSSREKRKELARRAGRSAACAGFKYSAAPRANTIGYAEEQANTLTADWHAPAVLPLSGTDQQVMAMSQYGTEIAGCLTARGDSSPCADRGQNIVGDGTLSGALAARPGMKQATFACTGGTYPINEQIATRDKKLGRGTGLGVGADGDPAFTLLANHPHMVASEIADKPAEVNPMLVRRLTPLECERLQGFPDGHTLIAWKGKPAEECPDGPRYKAIGNSMAVPVMRWIGERIAMAEAGGIS